MKGLFTELGMLIDLILIVIVIGALVLGFIWVKDYFVSNKGQTFSEALNGLSSNLSARSKNLYDDAKKLYEDKNTSASQSKLDQLYNSLIQENKTQEAQQVKDFNKTVSN